MIHRSENGEVMDGEGNARSTARKKDMMAIDCEVLQMERAQMKNFPGREIPGAPIDEDCHKAWGGSTQSLLGAVTVLTVDITNRCNMMWRSVFMDANQVG